MYRLFISCASAEFGELRNKLRKELKSSSRDVHIQEDFVPSGADALLLIDHLVQSSDKIVQILGETAGSLPDPKAVQQLLQKRTDFLRFVRELESKAPDFSSVTYTFWEAWLAIYHRREVILFRPTNAAHYLDVAEHISMLNLAGRPTRTFTSDDNLVNQILRSEQLRNERIESPFKNVNVLWMDGYDAKLGEDLRSRHSVVGRPASWKFLRENRYAPRNDLLLDLGAQFDLWWRDDCSGKLDDFPVFWIDGRSGDGKSVALLQMIERHILSHPDTIVVKVDDLTRLPDAHRWLATHYAGRALIVVDDLHRVLGLNSVKMALQSELDQLDYPTPIVTCGPTPERQSTGQEYKNLFKIRSAPLRGLNANERLALANWMGTEIQSGSNDGLLIELLFELEIGEPISAFARSFSERLKTVNIVDPVLNILAVNSLDLPSNSNLVPDERGQAFIVRLSKSDQRHFDSDAKFANGKSGIRFSHSRIAWRVFEEISQDPLTAIEIEARLAKHLVASLLIEIDDLDAIRRLLSRAISFQPLKDLPLFAECLVSDNRLNIVSKGRLIATLCEQFTSIKKQLGSSSLLNAGTEIAIKHPLDAMSFLRLSVPLLCQMYLCLHPDCATLESKIKSCLSDRAFLDQTITDTASNSLLYLITQSEARTSWENYAKDWISRFPEHFSTLSLHIWMLSQNKTVHRLAGLTTWLDANPTGNGVSRAYASLLSAEIAPDSIMERIFSWIDGNPTDSGVPDVIMKLLSAKGNDTRTIERALAWVKAHSEITGTSNLVVKLIGVTRHRPNLLQFNLAREHALIWLDNNSLASGVPNVLEALLEENDADSDMIRRSLDWIEANSTSAGASNVFVRLIGASQNGAIGYQRSLIIERSLSWIDENPLVSGAQNVLEALVGALGGDRILINRALEWTAANSKRRGASNVYVKLIGATKDCPESERNTVIEHALAWIDKNPNGSGVQNVLAGILGSSDPNPSVIKRALAWIDANSTNSGASNVLLSLMSATRNDPSLGPIVIERALGWVDTYPLGPGASMLLAKLVSERQDDPALIKRAVAWLNENPNGSGISNILIALLGVADVASEVIERALAWIDAYPKASGTSGVISKLVLARPEDPAVIDFALSWLEKDLLASGSQNLFEIIVGLRGNDSAVVDFGMKWLDANLTASGAYSILNKLMISADSHESSLFDWAERNLDLLRLRQPKYPWAFTLVTSLWRLDAPADRIQILLLKVSNDAKAIRYRANLVATIVQESSAPRSKMDFILALKDVGSTSPQFSTFGRIAALSAALAAKEVILASIQRPSDAKDLLYLIAAGAKFAESAGEMLLSQGENWPRKFRGYYWRAVLSCHDLQVDRYVHQMVAEFRSSRNPGREVLRALARRPDYNESFSRWLGPYINGLVTREMGRQTR